MNGYRKSLTLSTAALLGLLLAVSFAAGAFARDVADNRSPRGVVSEFFSDIKHGDRQSAVALWSPPDKHIEAYDELAREMTDRMIRDGRGIRSVSVDRLRYLAAPDGPSSEEAVVLSGPSNANLAEVEGSYVAGERRTRFTLTLWNANSRIPVLGRYLPSWRLYLADVN
jgi:hypothetical protein